MKKIKKLPKGFKTGAYKTKADPAKTKTGKAGLPVDYSPSQVNKGSKTLY